MKTVFSLIATTLALAGPNALAASDYSVLIKCSKEPYMVAITNSTIGGRGNGAVSIPVFVLQKNNQVVGTGNLKSLGEGFESSLLNAYIWTYQSSDGKSVIGVGVPGLRELAPGTYEGKADLIVQVNGEVMDGSTVPCEVSIQ